MTNPAWQQYQAARQEVNDQVTRLSELKKLESNQAIERRELEKIVAGLRAEENAKRQSSRGSGDADRRRQALRALDEQIANAEKERSQLQLELGELLAEKDRQGPSGQGNSPAVEESGKGRAKASASKGNFHAVPPPPSPLPDSASLGQSFSAAHPKGSAGGSGKQAGGKKSSASSQTHPKGPAKGSGKRGSATAKGSGKKGSASRQARPQSPPRGSAGSSRQNRARGPSLSVWRGARPSGARESGGRKRLRSPSQRRR
jgi:hypothetical protein